MKFLSNEMLNEMMKQPIPLQVSRSGDRVLSVLSETRMS